MAGDSRKGAEKEIGKNIISSENYLEKKEKGKRLTYYVGAMWIGVGYNL